MTSNALLGSLENPIRCKGVEGERDYLNRLTGPEGIPIEYQRQGSVKGPNDQIYDLYFVTYAGLDSPMELYFDMYATGPREKNSPRGLCKVTDFMKPKPWEKPGHMFDVMVTRLGNLTPDLPGQYAYIYSKAGALLGRGPYIYSALDFFGLPNSSWDLDTLMDCASQIVHELHGISPARPLTIKTVNSAVNLLSTFHFECVGGELPAPSADGLFSLTVAHRVTEEPTTIFFKVRKPARST